MEMREMKKKLERKHVIKQTLLVNRVKFGFPLDFWMHVFSCNSRTSNEWVGDSKCSDNFEWSDFIFQNEAHFERMND